MSKIEQLSVYRVVVVTHVIVGRFNVASNDINEVHEVAREWARKNDIGLVTEIRVTPKSEGGLPANIWVATK